MRYRLRTLLILLAIGPPGLAGMSWCWQDWHRSQRVTCQPAFRNLPAALANFN
jgi:hypothetical protein